MQSRFRYGQQWWKGRLKGGGYRVTLARELILKVLATTTKHLSAEEIYMKVHSIYPQIGLATVYRTLDILTNMRIIQKFDFGDGKARYELVDGPYKKPHHHHLICISCNKVFDYTEFVDEELELIKKTEKSLSKKYDFKILSHLIQFYGICKECRSKSRIS